MHKYLLALLVTTTITGCDSKLFSLREIKWATVDEYKIRQVIGDRFKDNFPYPQEINVDPNEIGRERAKLNQQISDITSAGTAKCREQTSPNNSRPRNEISSSHAYLTPPSIEPLQPYTLQNISEYQNCLSTLRSDQLISDLNEKLLKIEKIRTTREKHDRLVMEKLNTHIKSVITEYAKENNYDLVLPKNPGEIIYNKSKMTLDITEAILNSMQENKN